MNHTLKLCSHERIGCGHYPYNNSRSKDGEIFLPVPGPEPFCLYSQDNGNSWEKRPYQNDKGDTRFIQLQDGSFLALSFDNLIHSDIRNLQQQDLPYIAGVYRADSIQDIMEGKIHSSYVPIEIPGLCVGYGDSGNTHSGCISNGLIQLSNGDILATMYGQFRQDTTLCPYFQEYRGYDFYLYRSWCILSHDGGKSFSFLSTIADVQTYPIADVNAEGYCEPDAIEVEPGHLVSVIRTGGHEVYSPLYCTHSYDNGKTWEAPYEICDWGVLPRLLLMEDGTLVCASGHIHTMLLFSDDMGRTWSAPHILEPCDGKWANSPSGYNSIFESRPGYLTIVYDDPKEGIAEGAPEGHLRNVYIRTYQVQ